MIEWKVGQYYKTRRGEKVELLADLRGRVWRLDVALLFLGDSCILETYADGSSSSHMKGPSDVIAEWRAPHPAESWPIATKVEVYDQSTCMWERRYFKEYDKATGKFICFSSGTTPWSSTGDVYAWSECRLWILDSE